MKSVLLTFSLLLLTNSAHGLLASATIGGSEGTGGGDPCEERIQFIRDDIKNWIAGGGPNGFESMPISVEEYSKRMNEFLATTKEPSGAIRPFTQIECVHHPIEVQGLEKVCRFDTAPKPKITCFYEAFLDKATMNADEQVRLIHHEYAGLAKLEMPWQAQGQYNYSKQLVQDFMGDFKVRMLSITRVNKPDFGPPKIKISDIREGNYALDLPVENTQWDSLACGYYVQPDPSAREITLTAIANPAFPTECLNAGKTFVLKCATDEAKSCEAKNIPKWWGGTSQLWSRGDNSYSYDADFSLSAKPGGALLLSESDYMSIPIPVSDFRGPWANARLSRLVFHSDGAPTRPKYFTSWYLIFDKADPESPTCLQGKKIAQEGGLRKCQDYSANCRPIREFWKQPTIGRECGYAVIYEGQ